MGSPATAPSTPVSRMTTAASPGEPPRLVALAQGVDLLQGPPLGLADLEAREFMPIEDYSRIMDRFAELHPAPD